ncbi:MAG: HipA domain-containing protein, partial [Coxiellaceae bacterium]|nr:HipA domain-containing protein [Coxiellaceae bacterium]
GTVTDQPFDLLESIGRDCVGAIQLSKETTSDIKKIQAEPIRDDDIAQLLNNYRDAPLGMTRTVDDFRISMAGAQEKTALLRHNDQWHIPHGATPTTHIFKLPIGKIEHQQIDLTLSCENEWLCSQIANAFGLSTANCSIQHFNDVKTLVVERFDRKLSQDQRWIMRLPQEDMCQALGFSPNLKYQSDGGPGIKNIMTCLLASEKADDDRDNFYRTQILFWLLAAIDGHAKNFSLFIQPEGKFQATPLYDIMSAHPLLANMQLQQQKIKMAMALYGKNRHYHWYRIQQRHFISTAKFVNYDPLRAQHILDDMLAAVENVIATVSAQLPSHFPSYISDPIFTGMQQLSR